MLTQTEFRCCGLWVLAFACLALGQPSRHCSAESDTRSLEEVFEMRIRPVLSEHCFACHSAQSGKSNGGLRLDSRAALLAGGDTGPAISLTDPSSSLLVKAIRRTDPDFSMPPTGAGLSSDQIEDITQWIADGAVYPVSELPTGSGVTRHWAFQPVVAVTPPLVDHPDWSAGIVDRFIFSMLQYKQLEPTGLAEPHVVARRLAYLLTGLPPQPDEVDNFAVRWNAVSPESATAWYADELLARPQFGERWAQHWMDLVRYAEGAGGEYDYELPGAWRYRDYLVRALNHGLPYDQFLQEHIAGDLLAPRIVEGTNESLLATAWWNLGEAATAPVDLANDEAERMDNRLDVLGKAFTGLTIGCARCHDHKFDPLSTNEYYGLFGVAVATPAARTWSNQPVFDEVAKQLLERRNTHDLQARREFAANGLQPAALLDPTGPTHTWSSEAVLGDCTHAVPANWQVMGTAELVTPETAPQRQVEPGLWSGLLSNRLPALMRSETFVIEHEWIDVLCTGHQSSVQVIAGNFQLIRDPIYHNLRQTLSQDQGWRWVRFYVGRWKGQRAHVEVMTGTVDSAHSILDTLDHPDARFGVRTILHHSGNEPGVPRWTIPPVQVPSEVATAWENERAALEATIRLPDRFLGVAELTARDVPSYIRGNANRPSSETCPRKSPSLWADPAPFYTGRSGRAELAAAVTSPHNPLTARVFVNRVWQHVMGKPLVASVDNFGLLGDKPTHPELLDDLAYRFVHEHQWQLKPLLRELVTSRTFRLASSPVNPQDPANLWCSSGRLRRLDAEAVRDTVLAVSGQLDRRLGGPPVLVPHLLNLALSDSGNNIPASGPIDGDRRRSLYLAARRNFPSAFLAVFDRPTPLSTFGLRDQASSAAQALTMLNDPFVIEQGALWGQRMAGSEGTIESRITQMYRTAFSRSPTEAELAAAHELISDDPLSWEDLAAVLLNSKELIYLP